MLYLLHFSSKLANHAQHYLGYSEDIPARIQQHLEGLGSPLIRAAIQKNIQVTLVSTFAGDRILERKLKKQKNLQFLCPLCRHKALEVKAARMRLYRLNSKE